MAGSETELKDYGMVGRYRVRLVMAGQGPRLDIREYIDKGEEGGYTGFTKKGVRVTRDEGARLGELIRQALKDGL